MQRYICIYIYIYISVRSISHQALQIINMVTVDGSSGQSQIMSPHYTLPSHTISVVSNILAHEPIVGSGQECVHVYSTHTAAF